MAFDPCLAHSAPTCISFHSFDDTPVYACQKDAMFLMGTILLIFGDIDPVIGKCIHSTSTIIAALGCGTALRVFHLVFDFKSTLAL